MIFMEKELQDILNKLKESIEEPLLKEYDDFTEECYEIPNWFALDPTTNECKLLNDYITDLHTQLKKQKEVIDKIKEICASVPEDWTICGVEKIYEIEETLKEVSNNE